MNQGSVAMEANSMMSETDYTASQVCDAMLAEHAT